MSVSVPFALDTHCNANAAPVSPFASAMPSVDAVSVSPARATPAIVGAPVASKPITSATVTVTLWLAASAVSAALGDALRDQAPSASSAV